LILFNGLACIAVSIYSINKKPKPVKPPLLSTRLLDQLRERIRYLHYSLRTEQTDVYWVRAFVRWRQLKYPAQMGKAEVEAYLSWLASAKSRPPSTGRRWRHCCFSTRNTRH